MKRPGKKLGLMVFLNGLLQREGRDHDYELIHPDMEGKAPLVPKFSFNLKGSGANPDTVTVIDPQSMTRRDYTVELRPVLVSSDGLVFYPGKAG